MSDELKVAWAVVLFYLCMSALIAGVYALIFWGLDKVSEDDPEAARIRKHAEQTADAAGYTIWGMCVLVALRWPLIVANRVRKDH